MSHHEKELPGMLSVPFVPEELPVWQWHAQQFSVYFSDWTKKQLLAHMYEQYLHHWQSKKPSRLPSSDDFLLLVK